MKKKLSFIILSIGLVYLIAGIALMFCSKEDKSISEDPTDKRTEEKNGEVYVERNTDFDFRGQYKYGDIIIFVYPKDEKYLNIYTNSNDPKYQFSSSIFEYDGSDSIVIEPYTLYFSEEGLTISTTKPGAPLEGSYIKYDEVEDDDYYERACGALDYINSKYNGVYESDDYIIKSFQRDENNVQFFIEGKNTFFNSNINLEIRDNKLVYKNDNKKIECVIVNGTLSFNYTGDEESLFNELKGVYNKSREYTKKEIIENC